MDGDGLYETIDSPPISSEESQSVQLVVVQPCALSSLALNPSTTTAGTTVTATIAASGTCTGKNAELHYTYSCGGPAVSGTMTSIASGSGTVTFTAPGSSSTIMACSDLNSNGNFDDAGESASAILTVQAAPSCDASHLNLCATQAACTGANGYWYNSACNAAPQAQCDASNLGLCTSSSACSGAGGNWCNGACQAAACAPTCDASHLDLCADSSSCSTAGGNWCDSACQSSACAAPCSVSALTACTTQTDCTGASGYWYDNSCHSAPQCDASHLSACATYSECSAASGYWCSGVCRATECVTCSANYCSACSARGACEDQGCYWYNSACNAEQPPCSGTLAFVLDDESVAPGTKMTANVGGVSNCDGKQVVFKQDDCTGKQVGSCVLANNSCTAGFKAPKDEDEYSFVACLDRNNDGAFAGAEAVTTGLTVRPATKVAGFPEWIFFLIISIAAAAVAGAAGFFMYRGKKKKKAAAAPQPAQPELPF